MKTILLFTCIISFSLAAFAQNCNCPETFNWMVTTFSSNDAGFDHVLQKKGKVDYENFTSGLKAKTKLAKQESDCNIILNKWLHYFRSGHIGMYIKNVPAKNNTQKSASEIREQFSKEKTVNITESTLKGILSKKEKRNPVEGIWTNGDYIIGIISEEKSEQKFTAFIIKADSVYWVPKQIKAELTLNSDKKTFSVNYFLKDHSLQKCTAELTGKENGILIMYNNVWTRIYPETKTYDVDLLIHKFYKSYQPFVEKLSDKTIYLRIPSFDASQKKFIDSVIFKNNSLISSTPNLIIDIRNGTGGSDASYEKLMPFLYTNPIRKPSVEFLATELNAKAFENYAEQTTDSESVVFCRKMAVKLSQNKGAFVPMSEDIVFIDSSYKVLPFPMKIAIICNHKNGSTDEQFLIDAKQSSKVKVFGEPTGGMLDYSNVNTVDSPDGKFVLAYCLSRSFRIPNFCIDGNGVQPDIFIDNTVPETEWINLVKKSLEY